MGGINRAAPATDVSYERMLDDVSHKVASRFTDRPAKRKRRIRERVERFDRGDLVKHPLLPKNGEVQYTRGNTVVVKCFMDNKLYKFTPMSLRRL